LKDPQLQVKVKCQVNEQNQGSKVNLQTLDLNVKIELVKDASTSKFQRETIDRIYNQNFKKYLDYHEIQKSIIQNLASRTFNRAKDQLNHINYSYIFFPITCTSTQDIDLVWDDFF